MIAVLVELTGAGWEVLVPHAIQLHALSVVTLEPLEVDLRQLAVQRVLPVPQRQ